MPTFNPVMGAGFSLIHVPTDADKLAYVGPLTGGELFCIDDEGGRIEQFIPTIPTMVVSGGTLDGAYPVFNLISVRPQYSPDKTPVSRAITWDYERPNSWTITDALESVIYYSPDDVATPDLCTQWYNQIDGSPASITVIRRDSANQDNWISKNNRVQLIVQNNSSYSGTVNNMSCAAGTDTNLGYVDPNALEFGGDFPDNTYIRAVYKYPAGWGYNMDADAPLGTSAPIPFVVSRGDSVLLNMGNY